MNVLDRFGKTIIVHKKNVSTSIYCKSYIQIPNLYNSENISFLTLHNSEYLHFIKFQKQLIRKQIHI